MFKRLFALIFILCLLGCASNPTSSAASNLTPPSWILGTWSDSYDTNTFVFQNDDVVFIVDNMTISFKEAYKNGNITETKTSTTYEIYLSLSNVAQTYSFAKLTNTSLNYTLATNGISMSFTLSKTD